MEFERGGVFKARLLVEEAPDNTRYLVNAMPLEGTALHCMWSGQGVFAQLKDFPVNPGENQQIIGIHPGTVAIEYYPPYMRSRGPRTGVIVTYGPNFYYKNPYAVHNPLLLVGRIEEDLEELARIGLRIRRQGGERMRLRLPE
ncbi:DUF3830 family protein [Geochorda subterranea]|uniref:DUF3830 family protein n=1 Tax=Geochorda subterranea TaxID=3109564 RepID=A0ABZ1BR74_9FIRM|nr:DUF3830 family protein [Limnochorda sp. LNt]WRP15244.1 DUF3830 family protein [Limnochorda sp. LNt]